MYISRLFVRNYRNFGQFDIPLARGVTCFIGENNTGKTNLLSAVRLVLDGNLSPQRRRLRFEDLAAGLSFSQPEHVLIAVEFADFAGKVNEEALMLGAGLVNGGARLTFRFRPRPLVRDELGHAIDAGRPVRALTLDDYAWEMVGGGDGVDLATVNWRQNFGSRFNPDNLQQGFLVVFMEALRDVEARLASHRTSPLQQIVEQRQIPDAEQQALVGLLQGANDSINASATVHALATNLSEAFKEAAGQAYAMQVALGLGDASFTNISRGLRVLLSGYGMKLLDPGRNGLGLNNVLYISMLLNYFTGRLAEQRTAGQLLVVEEPEAHLHPQLQRVLLATLQRKEVQVFVTTHSTHITSGLPLSSQVVLTSSGTAVTQPAIPAAIPGLSRSEISDLERYLDATRSTLLYARKVLLVEGPAELFVIPPLAKKLLDIDFDAHGIAIVPIFGTHFAAYAKLFGTGGIQKKCAVVTDGDMVPSDANTDPPQDVDADTPSFERQALDQLEGPLLRVFRCDTTFERELATPGNFAMLQQATRELGAVRIADALERARVAPNNDLVTLNAIADRVLVTATRFGKARFAQTVSKHVQMAADIPTYIDDALRWLADDAANG